MVSGKDQWKEPPGGDIAGGDVTRGNRGAHKVLKKKEGGGKRQRQPLAVKTKGTWEEDHMGKRTRRACYVGKDQQKTKGG